MHYIFQSGSNTCVLPNPDEPGNYIQKTITTLFDSFEFLSSPFGLIDAATPHKQSHRASKIQLQSLTSTKEWDVTNVSRYLKKSGHPVPI